MMQPGDAIQHVAAGTTSTKDTTDGGGCTIEQRAAHVAGIARGALEQASASLPGQHGCPSQHEATRKHGAAEHARPARQIGRFARQNSPLAQQFP
jgi:hypothetical protein